MVKLILPVVGKLTRTLAAPLTWTASMVNAHVKVTKYLEAEEEAAPTPPPTLRDNRRAGPPAAQVLIIIPEEEIQAVAAAEDREMRARLVAEMAGEEVLSPKTVTDVLPVTGPFTLVNELAIGESALTARDRVARARNSRRLRDAVTTTDPRLPEPDDGDEAIVTAIAGTRLIKLE